MFIVKDVFGNEICARCGKISRLTKDHFIPKSCRMTVNREGNYVGICEECNREKANSIVLPTWYAYLNKGQTDSLTRYMRYARSYIVSHCNDEDILNYISQL